MPAVASLERRRISLTGAVQGVGFRPFVFHLATELGLAGWVLNDASGLTLEVEGPLTALDQFAERLERERPQASVVLTRECFIAAVQGSAGFEIRHSHATAAKTAAILPDLATCPECLAEILDPEARRYGYPFTNCTRCGPRYTIVTDVPYDRPNTTMRGFTLCPACADEYAAPRDRRFHAQPIACPVCGPQLSSTIAEAARVLANGGIVALKGIGGFQLLVDARDDAAVRRLRQRKHREAKPLAVMMPSLPVAHRYCRLTAREEELLTSAAAPIVLATPGDQRLAASVSGPSAQLGVMLPNSPLHHLLLKAFPHPVVATSGNLSGDPILIEPTPSLAAIADHVLSHNRPIARPCDDSVVRVDRGRVHMIRRARGYAPLPVMVERELPRVLAVGAHQKSTVAIAIGRQVFPSQHLGDLDTLASREAFEQAIADLCRLYDFEPDLIACDLHPDYASTQWARKQGKPVVAIQHHHAHAAACAAENGLCKPYLAVCWDGTGYGLDGTIWGGEFFVVRDGAFERVAHLRPFPLPGGEAAIRQGWRVAAALLAEAGLQRPADAVLDQMLRRSVNCPLTSSVGRLFDAVAAITGIARESEFEGHAAMLLEQVASDDPRAYPMPDGDWQPLLCAMRHDQAHGVSVGTMSARFHNTLTRWIASEARNAGIKDIVLAGGVFQNRRLTLSTLAQLPEFKVHTHQRVPANDGGIALGQAVLCETPRPSALDTDGNSIRSPAGHGHPQ